MRTLPRCSALLPASLAVLALFLLPTAASADSLVYSEAQDVGVAEADGCTGEGTRSMNRLALLRATVEYGSGGVAEGPGNTIVTYGVSLPGLPVMGCVISGAAGGEFGRPTWSPDGRSLAWAEGNGIWAMAL